MLLQYGVVVAANNKFTNDHVFQGEMRQVEIYVEKKTSTREYSLQVKLISIALMGKYCPPVAVPLETWAHQGGTKQQWQR